MSILTFIILLPILTAAAILLGAPARKTALAGSAVTLLLSVIALLGYNQAAGGFQFQSAIEIVPGWDLKFYVGADGLSLRVPAELSALEVSAAHARLTVTGAAGREHFHARLVVGADGAHSQVRAAAGIAATVEDYGQVALVANVATDQPHAGRAYERFTPAGPLAVLPLAGGNLAVIWASRPEQAARLRALGDGAYLEELQRTFGWRAGRFTRAGHRSAYPLQLTRAAERIAPRTVLIGNAAQALHPVAGQGFNLGLRDAAMLAEVLAAEPAAAGSAAQLERFAAWRAGDRAGVTGFTDSLVRLFGSELPGISLLRNLGLIAFDLAPPAKRALARVSAGFAGPSPRLARGLPVRHG